MAKIYNQRMIEGITTPVIIHNGNYFYSNMPILEDGMMDCWKSISLVELKDELEKGWVVTEIPDGENINIHGLGSYKILKSKWKYNKEEFEKYIVQVIKSMNSKMVGIFENTVEQVERRKSQKVFITASGIPFKLKGDYGYNLLNGKSTNILLKDKNSWVLTSLIVYQDKTISIDAISDRFFTLDELREMFMSNKFNNITKGKFTMCIPNLGIIECEPNNTVPSNEKLKEIESIVEKISGGKGLHEKCRKAYFDYLVNPGFETKEFLRKSYEAVPEHERMYLGDMDNKDTDYKRILYTDRKREV